MRPTTLPSQTAVIINDKKQQTYSVGRLYFTKLGGVYSSEIGRMCHLKKSKNN